MTEEKGLWAHTKEGTAKVWDKTKAVTEDAWDGAKRITEDVWEGTKEFTGDIWKNTKETGETAKHATSGDEHNYSDERICASASSDKSKKTEADKMMPRHSNRHLQ